MGRLTTQTFNYSFHHNYYYNFIICYFSLYILYYSFMYTYIDLVDMEHSFNIGDCVQYVSISKYYKVCIRMLNIPDLKHTGKLKILSVRR